MVWVLVSGGERTMGGIAAATTWTGETSRISAWRGGGRCTSPGWRVVSRRWGGSFRGDVLIGVGRRDTGSERGLRVRSGTRCQFRDGPRRHFASRPLTQKKTAEASPTFHMAVAGSPPLRHMADRGAEKGGDAAEAIPQPSTTAEPAATVATRAVWIGRRACWV